MMLAACLPATALAALPLQVQRVAAPAQLLHAGKKTLLTPRKPIEAGDRLVVGHIGRVGLRLVPSGELLLGEDSELFVHSAEPGTAGGGTVVRLALTHGSLHLDSLPRDGQPAEDMRLNVGTLRVRVLGAEVWAGAEPGVAETVCLLQGTVDIATDFGNEHLDTPGDCLRFGANHVRMLLRPENDGVLARKLARTTFAGDPPLAAPPAAVAMPRPPPSAPPTPLVQQAAEPPPAVTPAEPAPAAV
ncbi:MAG TPA: hypothetical protein VHE37_11285, partial [Nevskiaceae bacterium]|nr:hypothetical protein [Nevskiaceae bacterium]